MGWIANSLRNRLLDFLFRYYSLSLGGATATWSAAPVLYVGILGTVGDEAGEEVELSGTDYARAPITASAAAWNNTQGNTTGASTGSDGTIDNAGVIEFNEVGAGGWGTANGFGLYEASSGGSPIMAANQGAIAINEGDTPRFSISAMAITINEL